MKNALLNYKTLFGLGKKNTLPFLAEYLFGV
jgi:hypothetical protein